MFPSNRHHRFSTALLEVAEAMLRPLPSEDEHPGEGSGVDDVAWHWPTRAESAPAELVLAHPHRRLARIDRRRRPGTPAPVPQHCTTPSRPQRDPRPAPQPA
jgi:hypothetical protein